MKSVDWKLYGEKKEGTNAKRSMKSFEEFWNLLDEEEYELLSEYKNNRAKVKLKCPYKHEFEIRPYSFKNRGDRCPICSRRSKEYAKQQFEELVEREGYKLLSPYTKTRDKVKLMCPKSHKFEVTANNFKSKGSRCPVCQGLSKEYAKQEFEGLVKQEGYKLLSLYTNNKTKVKLCCPQGHEFEMIVYNFKNRGSRCPICQSSYGERTTYEYLQSIGLEFEREKTFESLIGVKGGGLLRYDFYIPSLNLLLEIQGRQHYESVELYGGEEALLMQIENDNRKKAFARAMGINLVEIKCNGENDGDKLKEELDKVINEYIFRFFSFKAS